MNFCDFKKNAPANLDAIADYLNKRGQQDKKHERNFRTSARYLRSLANFLPIMVSELEREIMGRVAQDMSKLKAERDQALADLGTSNSKVTTLTATNTSLQTENDALKLRPTLDDADLAALKEFEDEDAPPADTTPGSTGGDATATGTGTASA